MATAVKGKEEKQTGLMTLGKAAFSVERESLLNTLLLCAKIVPKTSAIPLLQCIKLDLKGEVLFITAMDLPEQAVLQFLNVTNDGGQDGSYLLNAKEFIDLVGKMPEGTLSFMQKDSTVTVKYGDRGRANLQALSSEQYPALPEPGNASYLTCPIEMLRKGAHSFRFVGSDESSPALTAVNLYDAEGKLGFMATNRHRVYRYISDIAIDNAESFHSGMIPAIKFKGIVDSLKSSNVDLAVTRNYLVLRDKNVIYFGKLLDGVYPDLNPVFGKIKSGPSFSVLRAMLDDTIKRMLSLVGVENNRVTLEVDESGALTMHSRSATGEICESFPDAKLDGEFPTIKFNAMYLRDALLVGDREVKTISLRTAGPSSPGYIEFDGDTSVVVVVNPVR
ncbi:DNA polymerase III subunit beta [Cohnella soli]|uniref:DNA polymerase III subunit beta n=1 Tax=Cohnella soli TaxID=425005 RepID=A0ABW0HR37_9BACL